VSKPRSRGRTLTLAPVFNDPAFCDPLSLWNLDTRRKKREKVVRAVSPWLLPLCTVRQKTQLIDIPLKWGNLWALLSDKKRHGSSSVAHSIDTFLQLALRQVLRRRLSLAVSSRAGRHISFFRQHSFLERATS
jgi:hypothetical protein